MSETNKIARIGKQLTTGRLLTALFLLTVLSGASAQDQLGQISDQSSETEIRQYCTNIIDPARDQRYLLQKQSLEKLQADVDARIAVLEGRKAEYQDWLKRRDDYMKKAEAGLVDVYKTMKPDAAAPQLEEMTAGIAAAIIMKLPARQSGLILSEMDAKKAAIVASIMSSAADPKTSKDPT